MNVIFTRKIRLFQLYSTNDQWEMHPGVRNHVLLQWCHMSIMLSQITTNSTVYLMGCSSWHPVGRYQGSFCECTHPMTLQCNVVSHWLGPFTKWPLRYPHAFWQITTPVPVRTQWGRLTHICVSKLKSLVHIMACQLVPPSHYLNQCWNIINLTLRNTFQWNFIWNSYIFIQNAFKIFFFF